MKLKAFAIEMAGLKSEKVKHWSNNPKVTIIAC